MYLQTAVCVCVCVMTVCGAPDINSHFKKFTCPQSLSMLHTNICIEMFNCLMLTAKVSNKSKTILICILPSTQDNTAILLGLSIQ
jgi:hypothetical protein